MGKYRSRLEIIAGVLSITVEGAKKTQIMYQTNLSYALLKQYLAKVLKAGLVSFEGSSDRYKLTRKGRRFLKEFGEYSRRLRRLEEQLDACNKKSDKMIVSGIRKSGSETGQRTSRDDQM